MLVNIFFSPGVHVDERILSLAYISGVLLTVPIIGAFFRQHFQSENTLPDIKFNSFLSQGALTVAASVIVAMNVIHAVDWIRNAHLDGRGFASLSWQESSVMEFVKRAESSHFLISNVPDAVYFLTGKPAAMMPKTSIDIVNLGRTKSSEYPSQGIDVWLVYMRTRLRRDEVPSEVDLQRQLSLKPVYGDQGGSIYLLEVGSAE
jgi:hypothetical protein